MRERVRKLVKAGGEGCRCMGLGFGRCGEVFGKVAHHSAGRAVVDRVGAGTQ